MSVIRFNPDDVFNTDSSEYEILINAVQALKSSVPGGVVEIGTRRGGSARMIIDGMVASGNAGRTMLCIDPYGNIEIDCTNVNMTVHYPGQHEVQGDPMSKTTTKPLRFDYTNSMRDRVIPSLYYYAYDAGMNFAFLCLEDSEFFKRYSDGFPTYETTKALLNEYAFVFYDGPHTNEKVIEEIDFFLPRTGVGGVYVFDDIWMYSHDELIESKLIDSGFRILEKGAIKVSYVRSEIK
jgi:cephalosporin hydroxylase